MRPPTRRHKHSHFFCRGRLRSTCTTNATEPRLAETVTMYENRLQDALACRRTGELAACKSMAFKLRAKSPMMCPTKTPGYPTGSA